MLTFCLFRFAARSPRHLWCSVLLGWSPSPYWRSYIMFHPLGPWTAEVERKSKTCWWRNYWENAGKWKHFGVRHYRKASQRNGIWCLMLSFPVPAWPSTEARFLLLGWRYYMILKKLWTIAQIAKLLQNLLYHWPFFWWVIEFDFKPHFQGIWSFVALVCMCVVILCVKRIFF